ncbi:MAG: RDD family protein [Cognaticolwellia sp.]
MIGNDEIVSNEHSQYAGFWVRMVASIIDSVLILMLTLPILYLIYGEAYFDSKELVQGGGDFFISYLLPIGVIILFWIYKSATPGKIALSIIIVDEKTGGKPSIKQYVIRYIGYYVSLVPLGLGFIWVALDEKKQGWHDKMAGTVVILDAK